MKIYSYSELKGVIKVGDVVRAVKGKRNLCNELQNDGSDTAKITTVSGDWFDINGCRHRYDSSDSLEIVETTKPEIIKTPMTRTHIKLADLKVGMTVICGDDEHKGSGCWRIDGNQVPQTITGIDPVDFISVGGKRGSCTCSDLNHLYLYVKTLETLTVGDFVKTGNGDFRQVLAVLHRNGELTAYLLSNSNKDITHNDLKIARTFYTAFELAIQGYTIHNPTPVAPVTKRMTVAEVSALVGETVVIVE